MKFEVFFTSYSLLFYIIRRKWNGDRDAFRFLNIKISNYIRLKVKTPVNK